MYTESKYEWCYFIQDGQGTCYWENEILCHWEWAIEKRPEDLEKQESVIGLPGNKCPI